MFRENGLIVLLGAGCSCEADIPTSEKMIEKLENLLNTSEWKSFTDLFNYAKSSALYSEGIKGSFTNLIDIEKLVNILGEIEKKENSIIYPFIGSWNPRLLELAGYDFKIIKEFKNKIVNELKQWVTLDNYHASSYYRHFYKLQSELNYSLRIFTLNYDLCLEKNIPKNYVLERGFDLDTKEWNWGRFEPSEYEQPNIYLYKLHGSIDWKREPDKGNILKEVDRVPTDQPDMIFGETSKLQYFDPYLFFAYEFRKYCLDAQTILAIGYGFGDEHINTILDQALQNSPKRLLFVVSPKASEKIEKLKKEKIFHSNTLNQIVPIDMGAKEFLETRDIHNLFTAFKGKTEI